MLLDVTSGLAVDEFLEHLKLRGVAGCSRMAEMVTSEAREGSHPQEGNGACLFSRNMKFDLSTSWSKERAGNANSIFQFLLGS